MGNWCLEENLSKRRQLTKKLVEGKEWAIQLKTILLQKTHLLLVEDQADESVSTQVGQLAVNIYASFTESLFLLNSNTTPHAQSGGDKLSQINPDPSHLDNLQCDERSSKDSGESLNDDRRGCYKRRKTSNSWKVVTSNIDDGQAWRKYGQKDILNAPYPRAYYRCTRKFEKDCRATKQVQQIQDNPCTYETTYFGQHTCRNMLVKTVLPEMRKDDLSINGWKPNNNYKFSTTTSHHQKNLVSSSSTYTDQYIIKKDVPISTKDQERTPSTNLSDNFSCSIFDTNNKYISWSDLEVAFELSEPTIFPSIFPKMMSDHNLGNMDFAAEPANINGSDFRFDHS